MNDTIRYWLILQRQWLVALIAFGTIWSVTLIANLSSSPNSQQPLDPSEPHRERNIPKILLFGGILGSLGGVVFALGVNTWQKRNSCAGAIYQQLGYPLLGVIPALRSSPESNAPLWLEDRTLHLLQSNLGWSFKTERSPDLVVMSSIRPQEGKSTLAANLALVTAKMRGRVLLVDANLRSPSQHEIWQVSNEFGLSTVLAGTSQLAESLVEIQPNLELLPAGILANTTEILWNSDRLPNLIQMWKQMYEVVILDAPALTAGADATLLANLTDGLILVVHPDRVDLDLIQNRQSWLDESDRQVLGMIINQLDPTEKFNAATERALVNRIPFAV
jgi:capsular exopolysaccharide synthesis family protein